MGMGTSLSIYTPQEGPAVPSPLSTQHTWLACSWALLFVPPGSQGQCLGSLSTWDMGF